MVISTEDQWLLAERVTARQERPRRSWEMARPCGLAFAAFAQPFPLGSEVALAQAAVDPGQ